MNNAPVATGPNTTTSQARERDQARAGRRYCAGVSTASAISPKVVRG
jgi:hypothetical protein